MKKLLAIDMDGTCLNDRKKISKKTLDSLKTAAESGIVIVPTTGRVLDCLPMQLRKETFYRYVITSNGARIFDTKDGSTVCSWLIPLKTAINVLIDAKKGSLGLSAHIDNRNFAEGKSLYLTGRLIYKKDVKNTTVTKDIIQTVKNENLDAEEIQLFYFNKNKKRTIQELASKYENLNCSFGHCYAEFYNETASKGTAITKLAEILGIEKQDVISIGNGENDLTMFESSGVKIAVENADENLKAKADFIVPDNNHDGVSYAIEKILKG